MKKLGSIRPLTTVFAYLFVGMMILVILFPALCLLALFSETRRRNSKVLFWFFDLFYRSVIYAIKTPNFHVLFEGEINQSEEKNPSIWVANHQSSLDIPLLGSLVKGQPHIWYALAYYANKPILGFFIKRIGFAIDQGSTSGSAHGLLRGLRSLSKNPCHVMIFPEGGRFIDDKIHDFLHGFVVIARKTKLPVRPVYMPFNWRVYPPRAFWLRQHQLIVIVGPLFELLPDETDEVFARRVHEWFLTKQSLFIP